ncbi:LLM class flavin-dependent oxidoreductase [Puerhibacterium puerhi]|uniref:LLM class flavin-dependent oxidoreductase n=1 Tax=Puerhibacterium puerhi TaxID=2692623 RepID=UPI001359ABA0|nr:LLM class flavin-dependent oxidoreductase [Puerhibacterium puerhi]
MTDILWYIPNQARPGHRGEDVVEHHNSLDTLTEHALELERLGWEGALLGTGWGRPDTLTVATALTARTTTFQPLVATRPGYWHPANFASAAATLDRLSDGRVRVNVVSGQDGGAQYGDTATDRGARYRRTREFLHLVRRLWTEDDVTHHGEHYHVTGATLPLRPVPRDGRPHPTLYFGGASPEAEEVAAAEADVQLFWGEPLDDVAERIDRLTALSEKVGRGHPPLRFGLRVTTFVRATTEEAWRDAEAKVARLARTAGRDGWFRDADPRTSAHPVAVGQQRLLDLAERGVVLDENLYTAPVRVGGGGAGSTWLVGSPEDVAGALRRYRELGITHFVLSDTPYLSEIRRQGEHLLPLLR